MIVNKKINKKIINLIFSLKNERFINKNIKQIFI